MNLKYRILKAFDPPSDTNQVRKKLGGSAGLPRVNDQVMELLANGYLHPDHIKIQRKRKQIESDEAEGNAIIFPIHKDKIIGRKNIPPSQQQKILYYHLSGRGRQYVEFYEDLQTLHSSIKPISELALQVNPQHQDYLRHLENHLRNQPHAKDDVTFEGIWHPKSDRDSKRKRPS